MPHAPWRGTSTLALLVTLLLVGESLAWGSLGSLPVIVVIFVAEGCVSARGGGGIIFVVQSAAFSSSHLSPVAWLVRRPISGTCDYLRGCGFCWFAWYPHSPPKTFHSPRSCHAQGLGNSPAVGIWLSQADDRLLRGGLIPPCLIIVLTSTQVLPTDGANCKVPIFGGGGAFHCRCERTQTQRAQYNEFGREAGLRTGPL